jgi:hypothetical protein
VGDGFEIWDDAGNDATIVSGTISQADIITAHNELTGLDADDHTQYLLADGTRELTADWDAGSYKITAEQIESDVGSGTAPFIVASSTFVDNLNADMVDGYHLDQELTSGSSPSFDGSNFTDLYASGVAVADTGGYFVSDNVEGALQELGASITGASGADFHWHIEGALTPLSGIGANWVVPRDSTIEKAIFYIEDTGVTGTTTIDINRNSGSIFIAPPEIQFNDADGIVTAIPDTISLTDGDLITFDIDSAASGSSGLDIYIALENSGSGGGGGGSITVEEEDGDPSVSDVDTIKVTNGTLTDNGDGSVSINIEKEIASQIIFSIEGANLNTTGDKNLRFYSYLPSGIVGTITKIFAYVNTAPDSSDLHIYVKKSGVNILTDSYIEISIGSNVGETTDFDDDEIITGDYWTFGIEQGDSVAADLTIHIQYTYIT